MFIFWSSILLISLGLWIILKGGTEDENDN